MVVYNGKNYYVFYNEFMDNYVIREKYNMTSFLGKFEKLNIAIWNLHKLEEELVKTS